MINYLGFIGFKAKRAMKQFFTKENGEVNVVAIVVLIAVAVVLALLLKDQIAGVIRRLIASIEDKAGQALTDA